MVSHEFADGLSERKKSKKSQPKITCYGKLGNCTGCRQPFHDSAQQHACKGCGGKWNSDAGHSSDEKTYPNTPLSEFKTTDDYVHTHGLDALVDDEQEEKDEVSRLPSLQRFTLYTIQ